MGKVFNKGLEEEDKKEGHLRKLKNIEDKNEKQSDKIKDQGERQPNMVNEKKKEPRKVVRLKDQLDYIFTNFSSNFDKFLKLAKDEEKIDYNDLFFEIDDSVIKSYNFLENVGTLYNLLLYLMKMKPYLILQPCRLI